MKLPLPIRSAARLALTGRGAFTFAEIMTAMGLFSLVVIGVVSAQLFGMRLFNITSTRLSASDSSRKVLNSVRDDVRSGKILHVGNGDSLHFTNIALNGLRQGNALQIHTTTDTNAYIRYYLDPASQCLMRAVSGGGPVRGAGPVPHQSHCLRRRGLRRPYPDQRPEQPRHQDGPGFLPVGVSGGASGRRGFLRLLPSANPDHPPNHRVASAQRPGL